MESANRALVLLLMSGLVRADCVRDQYGNLDCHRFSAGSYLATGLALLFLMVLVAACFGRYRRLRANNLSLLGGGLQPAGSYYAQQQPSAQPYGPGQQPGAAPYGSYPNSQPLSEHQLKYPPPPPPYPAHTQPSPPEQSASAQPARAQPTPSYPAPSYPAPAYTPAGQ